MTEKSADNTETISTSTELKEEHPEKPEVEPKNQETQADQKDSKPKEKSKSKSPSKSKSKSPSKKRNYLKLGNRNKTKTDKNHHQKVSRRRVRRPFRRGFKTNYYPKRRLQRAQNAYRRTYSKQRNGGFRRHTKNRPFHFKPRRNLRLRKVFVGGLPRSMKSRTLFNLFRFEGRLLSARIIYDKLGYSRGFGILEFANPRDSWKVIRKWNETFYNGFKIKVAYKKRFRRGGKKQQKRNNGYRKTSNSGNMGERKGSFGKSLNGNGRRWNYKGNGNQLGNRGFRKGSLKARN